MCLGHLGYAATTAYRAQGRTVDAAHAYVTIATVLEHVMTNSGLDVAAHETARHEIRQAPPLLPRLETAQSRDAMGFELGL